MLQVGQRFSSTPVGTTTISNNTMIRDGDLDPNWQFGVGALWFDGSQGTVTGPINVTNALIEQSPFEAIQWVEGEVNGVNLNNVTIAGTGTFALQEQDPGTASATNVVATGVAQANAGNAPSYSCEGSGFTITDGGGNSGITPTQCNGWPAPVYPPYPNSPGVTVAPTALNFGSVATGTTSGAQTVTVSNSTSSAAPVSSIAASGDFAQTSTCGSSIAAGASCTVSVTFTPTATGSRTGTLTVNAGGTANTVSLSGTGTGSGGGGSATLTASPASVSFGSVAVGSTAGPQTVTVTNTGSAAASVSSVSAGAPFAQTSTCGSSIAAGGSCTVSVTYTPTATGASSANLTVASNATNPSLTVALSGTGTSSGGSTNLAAGAPISASSYTQNYVPANANDGNTSTYWEGTNGVWPTTLTVNLGASDSLSSWSSTCRRPPRGAPGPRRSRCWARPTAAATPTLVGPATYTFNPATGNTVTIGLPSGSSDQYVQLSFTANSVQNGAQVSELDVFGP